LFGRTSWDLHGASRDGQVLAIPNSGGDGAFVLHRGDNRVVRLSPHADVRHCAVSVDGQWVATGRHWTRDDASVKVWDAHTGKHVQDLVAVPEGSSVQFSPDGKWLLAWRRREPRLWSVGDWKEGPKLGSSAGGSAAFSADGRLLALTDAPGVVRLVAPDDGKEIARLSAPLQTPLHPHCFTPDGTRLVCGGLETRTLYVFRLDLIRRQLLEMGLDWDVPSFRERHSGKPDPLVVTFIGGDFRDPVALNINHDAWRLLVGAASDRDPERALKLAQDAVKREPGNANYLNTLGVALYRNGRYRDAIDSLQKSLAGGKGASDGFDLYFLAMAHARLGEKANANDCFARAEKWQQAKKDLSPEHVVELKAFRDEAAGVLGLK